MKTVNFCCGYFFLLLSLWLPLSSYGVDETELTAAFENPGHEEKPDWFKVSFLDVYEDVAEAAEADKRLMIYFFQDGCPYCKKLLEDNFGQRDIALKTQKHFDVVAVNIWGDREVTVGDRVMTEKQFAAALRVQYTPTLLFFNENKKIVFRANGYYSPGKFNAVLDYAGMRKEKESSFLNYMASVTPVASTGKLHTDVVSVADPSDLAAAMKTGKHMLVMFEQRQCASCDELHLDILQRPESQALLKNLNVALFDMWSNEKIVRPDGKKSSVREWAKDLDIKYAPSLVYFNDKGEEVFRSDAYLKAFHVQSVMDYVVSGAYQHQANFQRYIDERAELIRELGVEINLMN